MHRLGVPSAKLATAPQSAKRMIGTSINRSANPHRKPTTNLLYALAIKVYSRMQSLLNQSSFFGMLYAVNKAVLATFILVLGYVLPN